MDKTSANFNKDWGYMACVKSARVHARAPAPAQPRPAVPPTTPQPRPAPRRAVITPPPVPSLPPTAAAASDEAWLANVKGAADAKQVAALEALRDRPLVARDESFGLIVRVVRETTTVPALVARATQLVDGLERARRQTVADLKQVPATPSTRRLARFVLSPSTLGVYIHYRCPRVLLRLAKRNAGLDYRVRATEASRGSTATKAFDSGAAIVPGGPTDRDVSEAAAALSMVSLVSGRGSDHEMWLNGQLETVGVACESWFRSEVAAEVPRTFHLVDVEQKARTLPRNGVRFEEAYDALSLHHLREAPVGTALFQPALNVKLIGERIGPSGGLSGERRVYAALGLLDAFDRGDVSLSRALVDYVLVVPDALGRRSLVVIDAKASKRVKLEHQIQVTLYTMLIDVAFGRIDFMAAVPGVCVVGGVWLPARAAPQIFEVAGLQKKVRDMLANEVSALLTADAHARSFEEDTDDWVLRTSCGTCNFRASCEKQAASRGRLCALPGLRPDDAVELKAFAAGAAAKELLPPPPRVRRLRGHGRKGRHRDFWRGGLRRRRRDDAPRREGVGRRDGAGKVQRFTYRRGVADVTLGGRARHQGAGPRARAAGDLAGLEADAAHDPNAVAGGNGRGGFDLGPRGAPAAQFFVPGPARREPPDVSAPM